MRLSVVIGVVSFTLASAGAFAATARQIWPRRDPSAAPSAASVAKSAPSVRADGRVAARPGAQVTVGAELSATIKRVAVQEGALVKKGDVLLEFRAAEHASAVWEARAASTEAAARFRARTADVKRVKKLAENGSVSRAELDALLEEQRVARARLSASKASISRFSAVLARSNVIAPIDGVIVERNVDEGETVVPGTPLFTIVDLGRLRIEAEIDEFDIARAVVGAPVTIRAEGLEGQSWEGAIEEVPPLVTKRRLRPLDPSRPTDTAVLLAKVTMPTDTNLKIGQRVILEVRPSPELLPSR